MQHTNFTDKFNIYFYNSVPTRRIMHFTCYGIDFNSTHEHKGQILFILTF